MKILVLADPSSPHTIKWVNSLSEKGNDIYLLGLNSYHNTLYKSTIMITSVNLHEKIKKNFLGSFSKIIYLSALNKLNHIINDFQPDILHSHYASSYGLLGALTNFHPFIISVWGSDVFNFPNQSFLYKKILKYSLSRADKILSTSEMMAKEVAKYTSKKIEVTPFGVDLEIFKPFKVKNLFDSNNIVIGTVKSLEKKYGVDLLIKSFKKLKEKHQNLPIKLLIVGSGSQEEELKELTEKLQISDQIIFTGYINPIEIPRFHNMIDISLFLSTESSESFGVAVIEASACEKPVIVSNIGGLPEVVENNSTGIIVEPGSVEEISNALETLIFNSELRNRLGKNGRERVKKFYDWNNNVAQMENIYQKIIENFSSKT